MTITRDLGPTGTPSNIAVPWDAAYYLSTRASSRFVVAVESSPGVYQSNHVYGFGAVGTISERGPQEYPTGSWAYHDRVEASWTTFAANQTATVLVGLRSGIPITSAVIYPANLSISYQIAGGLLVVLVPQDVRLLIEVNGNTKDTLCIYSDPLSVDAVPAPAGANTITINNQADLNSNSAAIGVGGTQNNPLVVVFNPGLYEAPTTANTVAAPGGFTPVTRELDHMLWKVGPYTHVHLKRGTWFVGNMDWRGTNDGSLSGAGTISGEWATWSDMLTKLQGDHSQYQSPGNFLTFYQQVAWCALVGTTYDDNDYTFPNLTCSGVSLVGHPFWTAAGPFNSYTRIKVISHWLYNCDGLGGLTLNPNTATRSCVKSFAMCGDDGMILDFNYGETYYTDCHVIAYGGAPIMFGYWSEPPDIYLATNKRVVTNCTVQTRSSGNAYGRDLYSGKNTDELGSVAQNDWSPQDSGPSSNWTTYGPYAHPAAFTESVVKGWMDGDDDEPKTWGKFNVTIDGLYVENTVRTALFSLENCFYPFGFVSSQSNSAPYQAEKAGNASNWTIKNVFVQNAPTWRSRLIGRDKLNTFHDISFSNINIAGTRLTVRNWDQYVVQNEAPYNIFVEGRIVVTAVDICNLALSHIGESATVTSIAPPDGSAQSILCNQFFNRAVEELLEMHAWSFATARADLVETATNDVDGWKYSYAYPPAGTEIVRTLQVLPDGYKDTYVEQMTKMQPAYTIEQASTGSLVLYTDLEDAEVRYVKFVYTPGFYPPLFITTLSWLLASKLAGPIMKGDVGSAESKRCLQQMQFYLGKAASSDSNQRITDTNHSAPWISGR